MDDDQNDRQHPIGQLSERMNLTSQSIALAPLVDPTSNTDVCKRAPNEYRRKSSNINSLDLHCGQSRHNDVADEL